MDEKVTSAINHILADSFSQASNILSRNRVLLESSAEQLIGEETIDEVMIYGIHTR